MTPSPTPSPYCIPGIELTSKGIIDTINSMTGINLTEKSRKREILTPRQIAMVAIKKHTKLSLAEIGADCGNKDHATVLHAHKTINNLIDTDKYFVKTYREILLLYKLI